MKKLFYTWKQFDNDVEKILKELKKKPVSCIYAIPKGGLVLGTTLANYLSVPLFTKENEFLNEIKDKRLKNKSVLIVDDISDSGETFLKINNIFEYTTIALFKKEDSQFIPNIFCNIAKKDEWVVYCWEPESKKMKRDCDL